MKHITLFDVTLTKKEEENIVEYCSILGYIYDPEPVEFNGKYPLIRKSLTDNRKGYIQKHHGNLHIVYGRKTENLSFNIAMFKAYISFFDRLGTKRFDTLLQLMSGITDFQL